jgi:tetratricopeptide (TPR) repeat protein
MIMRARVCDGGAVGSGVVAKLEKQQSPFSPRWIRGPHIEVSRFAFLALTIFLALGCPGHAQRRAAAARPAVKPGALNIQTEANAIIWLDEIRRGAADADGRIALTKISAGRHTLHVRATGFREATIPVPSGQSTTLVVRLLRTTDDAELAFQQAEEARDKAKDDEARKSAEELYGRALKLRPAFPAAHVGLARVLMDRNQYQQALSEIEAARRTRAIYPEASAVEGRIYREMAFADEAVRSFQRAIREARGSQPEAHVGLARVYEERGQYDEATAEYQTSLKQLFDTEPLIYQLLGAAYEKVQKYKEAVGAYEKYLELAPNGNLAPAVRSILDQVRREASGQELSPN